MTKINDFHLTLQIWLNGSKFIYLKDTTYYWIQRELSVNHVDRVDMSVKKYDTLIMDWNRYIKGKHPEYYADFLYRAYNFATAGYSTLFDKDIKKIWRAKMSELFELSWGDYIKSDALLHEKAAMWWLKHFPGHKPFFSKLKHFLP